jgi:mono/diheme cytochrome c family protein
MIGVPPIRKFLRSHNVCFVTLLAVAFGTSFAAAQDAADFFRGNCMSCHTIGGGRLTGPDLKNVTQRKERAWLAQFVQAPQSIIDKGDPYALKLQEEARGVVMPMVPGMTPAMAELLLTMIEEESKLPKSQFAGLEISDRPFTSRDIALGKQIFTGERRLANGGPPCISCHTMNGIGAFGGGRLGPDLSKVYERLQGRRNVGTWLFAPATPTMQPVFRRHAMKADEILPLLALLETTALAGGEDDRTGLIGFSAVGFFGTVLVLAVLGAIWKNRLQAVRRPIVENSARRVLGGRA